MENNYYAIHKNKKPKKIECPKREPVMVLPAGKWFIGATADVTNTEKKVKLEMLYKFNKTGRYVK